MKIQYLNTDLTLKSPNDLTPIVNAFAHSAVVLHNDKRSGYYYTVFESIDENLRHPNSVITHFAQLVDSLNPHERRLWNECYSKTFDIGYEGGTAHQSYTDEIRADTLVSAAHIGAGIAVTVYPMYKDFLEIIEMQSAS
ncbi:hypothetical protein [Pseudoalteromonas xiamenensis]